MWTNQRSTTNEKSLFLDLQTKSSSSASTQTEPMTTPASTTSTDKEWRMINSKKVWKADWSDYDKFLTKKMTPEPVNNKKRSTKKHRHLEQQPRQPSDNFYDILSEFDHQEPPSFEKRHEKRSRQNHQPQKLHSYLRFFHRIYRGRLV
jgi:hypothetical protein